MYEGSGGAAVVTHACTRDPGSGRRSDLWRIHQVRAGVLRQSGSGLCEKRRRRPRSAKLNKQKKKRCEKAAMIPYITTGAIVSANKENKNVDNKGNDSTSGKIKPSHHLSILLELGSYPPFPSSHHTLVNTPARSMRRQITLQQPPSPNLPRWKTDGSSPAL